MLMIRISLLCFFLFTSYHCKAQDIKYARRVVKTLCGKNYYGRGYVNNGDGKAAEYIRGQYAKHGLKPLADNYFQRFAFPVNAFPGKMILKLNGKTLKPGVDFQVSAGLKSRKGSFEAVFIPYNVLNDHRNFLEYCHQFSLQPGQIQTASWLIIDTFNTKRDPIAAAHHKYLTDTCKYFDGIVSLTNEKFTWTVETQQEATGLIEVHQSCFTHNKAGMTDMIDADIESVYDRHNTQNVIGYFKGSEKPDSFIVLTAHYDHLGMMGKKTIFPGANDNASGIAMLLNMAQYYQANPPKYSMLFIAFAGEEAGLIGSRFYTENPVLSLSKISFLINLDLIGTGEDGMMAVNGAVFTRQYDLLTKINNQHHYLSAVKARGKAANSDHYWFSEKGVPCFFFYLMGPYTHYHDVYDRAEALPMTKFNEAFLLFRDFTDALQ